MKMRKFKLLTVSLLIITFLLQSITAFAGGETTIRDITWYPDITAPTHPHIWQYAFDDTGHWRECTVCHTITSKQSHNKYPNNGTKYRITLYQDDAYRDVCNCGWKGPAQRVIYGRAENYSNSSVFINYATSLTSFSQVRLISRTEFNQNVSNGTYPERPQGYTFQAISGNNGYVYGGGAIPGLTYYKDRGIKSSLVCAGSYDGFGAKDDKSVATEFSKLCIYASSKSSYSRADFLSTIPSSVGANHPMYGMYQKYASMSDYVFNRIMTYFVGMSMHGVSWGCGPQGNHQIIYSTAECPGSEMLSFGPGLGCFTANGTQMSMWDETKGGTCAICSYTCTGREHLTYIDYEHHGSYGTYLKYGQTTSWGSEHPMYYQSTSNIVSYTRTRWRRNNIGSYQVQAQIRPASSRNCVVDSRGNQYAGYGQTYTTQWHDVPITDSLHGSWYTWVTNYWVYDSSWRGQRQIGIYCPYAVVDVVDPVAYGTGNASYWQLTGNGTVSKTSAQATIKCTFQDSKDYSANEIFVHLLDSDGKTFIPQDNGVEWKGLNVLSGNLWQGVLDVPTEVNGTKTIYVQAKDSTGNLSAKIPIQVSYIDAKGPTLTMSALDKPNTEWTRTKTITISGKDAFNNVKIGLSETPDGMVIVSNDEYGFSRTITFTGNVTDPKAVAIFGQDFTGNLTNKDITVAKLDNTIPVVKYEKQTEYNGYTDVTLSGTDYQITSKSNKDNGSGVKYYGVSTSPDVEPTEWQTSPVVKITETGTYYFWDKDGVDWVSEPTEGIYVPVRWTLTFDYDKPDISTNPMTDNSPAYKTVTHLEQTGSLPSPKIQGWTFLGWKIYDADEQTRPNKIITYDRQDVFENNTRQYDPHAIDLLYSTIWKWKEDKTAQAEWRENRYTVIYDDQQGNEYHNNVTYLYDHSYEAPTQEESGFERPGYYIAYWSESKRGGTKFDRFWSKDVDWPVGENGVQQYFKNLTDVDGDIVRLYAIWKPIPYTIRLHDNYLFAATPYKDYEVNYETKFTFPNPKLWDHNATHVGYDRESQTFVNPEWKWSDTVASLTVERNAIVSIYMIWDNPPTITCNSEIYLNAQEVVSHGLTENDASVTRSQLEAWLLTKCTANDWEYQYRYGSNQVPPGTNHGYTLKVSAFDPAGITAEVDGATAVVYYVTFEVTDDAGQTATASSTVFVSDKVNILVN